MLRRPPLFLICMLLLGSLALPAHAQYVQQGPKLGGSNPNDIVFKGFAVALSADGATAALGAPFDSSLAGSVLIYTRAGGAWVQQGPRLLVSPPPQSGIGKMGQSVALSADGNTLVAGIPWGHATRGGAAIFTRSGGVWTQQGPELRGSAFTPADQVQMGCSVAISADGNTMVMGGFVDSSSTGAAWVFTRTAGVWTQQGPKLVGTGGLNSGQGWSVAVSGDGNTVLVGGARALNQTAAAWIFHRTGGTWTQVGSKLAFTGASGEIGTSQSVALSFDGNTAAIGEGEDHNSIGAVWIFALSGGVWSQQGAKLTAVDTDGAAGLGGSVALSSDGSKLVVGANLDAANTGAAFVFARDAAGQWAQKGGKLVPSGGIGASRWGSSVAISADASVLVAGGPYDNNDQGAAAVFVNALAPFPGNAQLIQQGAKLVGAGAAGSAGQGTAVAISKDGNTAAVGGTHDNGNVGATWVYTRSGAAWSQQGVKLVGTGVSGATFQGGALSLSRDGSTLAVGSGNGSGAWIFVRNGALWSQQARVFGTGGISFSSQGISVALSDDGNTLIMGGHQDNSLNGAIWVFTRSGSVWTQQGPKLVASDANGQALLGSSVAVSPDGNLAVAGGPFDQTGRGAAWVFARTLGVWAQQGSKIPGGVSAASAGSSVAVSADGATVLLGALSDVGRVFVRSGATWVPQSPTFTTTAGSGLQSAAVALSADGDMALVANADAGSVWAFTRRSGAWSQLGPVVGASDALPSSAINLGGAVSVSADGNTAIFGGTSDNNGIGAAWILTNPLAEDCQFASYVRSYSSQYSATGDEWHAVRALGSPNVYPYYRDDAAAWASAGPDDGPEYLDLGYAHGARINFVNVYETYSPGAIDTISVRNPYSGAFETVWTGVAAPAAPQSRVFTVSFPTTRFPVSEVRVHLNSPAVPDWNEIDAVDIGYRDLTAASQWASAVVARSSEFSAVEWGAAQALGAPNLYPVYGDDPRAWASNSPDGQQEFLDLSYATPQPISFVNVYETYAPDALKKVSVKDPSTGSFVQVWSGAAAPAAPVASIRTITFPETRFAVSEVKLEFDSPAVPDWNEIDAVGIGRCTCLATLLDAPPVATHTHDILELARPNPFHSSTAIAFSLSHTSHVKVEVFSILGERVATVVDGTFLLGRHEARWDGRDAHGHAMASGVYYMRIASPTLTGTRKVVKIE